jgi:hypothetical protein
LLITEKTDPTKNAARFAVFTELLGGFKGMAENAKPAQNLNYYRRFL